MPLSVKTKEHIRRRLAVELPKWGALAGGAAALALSIAFTHQALHFVVVSDTHGGSTRILTASTNVDTLLRQSGTPPLGQDDQVVRTQSADGESLQVLRAYTVEVTADGETRQVVSTGATAGELLAQLGIAYDGDDRLSTPADQVVAEGEALTLQRVEYKEYTEDVVVPAELQQIPSSLFYRSPEDALVLQEGSEGLDTVTWREVYLDGEWSATEEVYRVTQVGMVPDIVKVYGEGVPVSAA